MIFPELRSDRLMLRRITVNDKVKVFEGLSNKDVIRYYGVSYDTLDSIQEQMDWYEYLEDSGTGLWWAITDDKDGTFYGACGLSDIDFEHLKAEVGIWILPEYWGKGLMSEASKLMLHYGFNRINLHRLEGTVEAGNEVALKAFQKLGFLLEGTMRESEIKDGKFISIHLIGMLKQEFDLV
jgi:[ribosomal protein S5]-alanine N-acetyltransferase